MRLSRFDCRNEKVVKPLSKVIALDLQSERNQQLLMDWTSRRICLWVHFGVPCGTSSRAREIRLSKYHHGPRPMRSADYPDGLPPHELPRSSLDRLRAANRLYALTVRVIRYLNEHTIWTVENPSGSYLWDTSYFQGLLAEKQTFRFEYHMCMFGGFRFK